MQILKKNIANLLTFSNVILAYLAIISAYQGLMNRAWLIVLVCAIIDGMDGQVARRLKITSAFGKQLDSFSDLMAFGFTPMLIIMHYDIHMNASVIYLGMICYLCAAVYRLARFHVQKDNHVQQGLPITMAAVALAFVFITMDLSNTPLIVGGILIGLAGLKISGFKWNRFYR